MGMETFAGTILYLKAEHKGSSDLLTRLFQMKACLLEHSADTARILSFRIRTSRTGRVVSECSYLVEESAYHPCKNAEVEGSETSKFLARAGESVHLCRPLSLSPR